MSICVSTTPSDYHNLLFSNVGADMIYSTLHKGKTVYGLITSKTPKMHSTLDKRFTEIDKILQNLNKTPGKTYLINISSFGNGKALTYSGANKEQDKEVDEYYRALFNIKEPGRAIGRKHNIQPGVTVRHNPNGRCIPDSSYDIVKKRKLVDAANEATGADVTEALLGEEGAKYFFEFSNAVKEAFETLTIAETKVNEDEAKWMASDEKCIAGTRVGNVYAAKNPGLGPPIKIGATSKATPCARLKELSSCLPHSFQLVASIQTVNPFALEKKVHDHFAAARIKKDSTGRNTEFFMVSEEEVDKYFEELMQDLSL